MEKPTKQHIDDVLNKCADMEDSGENPFFGMTYAQGVRAAIEWMQGDGENPLE
jgi:hypothetical protein